MLETVPTRPSSLTENMRDRWEQAEPNHKIGLAALLSFVIAMALVWSLTDHNKEWRPLLSGASPEQAAQVVQKLEEMGESYRLAGDGSSVLVPVTQLQRLKVELAGAGLVSESLAGFELFENVNLGRSDFSEQVTYLRALQGELAHTIEALGPVAKARVHINMPKQALFLDDKISASAAVYVKLKAGTQLNSNQVAGIVHLVANSVEGLEPAGVTLFDASGGLHIRGSELEEQELMGGSDPQQRAAHLTRVAQKLVDRVIGPGNGLVTVQVEIQREFLRSEKERAEPGAGGTGVLLKREEKSEDFEGTRPSKRGASEQEPGPGVESAPAPADGGKPPRYTQRSQSEEFAVTRIHETLEQRPGATARMTASVLVDSAVGLNEDQLQVLSQGVQNAIGFDPQRGDRFELQALPFNRKHLEEMQQEVAEVEQTEAQNRQYLLYGLAALGGIGVLGLLGRLLRNRRKKRKEVWMDVNMAEMGAEANPDQLEAGAVDLLLPAEIPDEENEEEEESVDELLVRALEAVEREPEMVARLLERWVEGDESYQ